MAVEVKLGTVFGQWTVLAKLDYKQKYLCQCACGLERNIRIYDLLKGKTRMCRPCASAAAKTTHGQSSNCPEYNTWMHMIQRCYNPNNKSYKDYGGRGIVICDLWRNSFEAFYMSVGPRPTLEHTIERLDYNGNYEPGNVTWATRQEQVLNKSDNVNLTINGETKAVSQWAKQSPVTAFTIYKRVRRGWGAKEAVFLPSTKRRSGKTKEEEKEQ